MAGIVGFVVLAAGIGGYLVWQHIAHSEKFRAAEARKAYDEGLFAKAENDYRDLVRDFPDSEHADDYAFLADVSKVRKGPTKLSVDPKEELENLAAFLRQYGKHPLMAEHLRGVGETYVKLVKDHIIAKRPARPDHSVDEQIYAAEGALREMQGDLMPAITAPERAEVAGEFARIRDLVVKEEQRRADIVVLQQLKPTVDGIRDAELLIRQRGLANDDEAKGIVEELYRKHPSSVEYTKEAAPKAQGGRAADTDRSLLVDAKLRGEASAYADQEGVVLALVRGVLYALRQADGAVQWAVRVGIDTTTLPVRVRATPGSPELILVLSADTYTLTALDTGGRQVWKYRLTAPSLGRPVIIKDRAFLSTFDGQVHEIELARGLLLGRYTLGEGVKLSAGGVHQPGTNLIYFPADEFCFFVLDVENHTCETILYTKHRSGSLRGEPIIASWTERDANGQVLPQGYLFLNLTEDLDSMRLRAYPLPIENPRAEPLPMNPEPRTLGWTWFPPHQDAEKIVQVSDAGTLALVGVKQKRNEDNPLFPLLPPSARQKGFASLDLVPLLKPPHKDKERERHGRSLIAYAAEPDNFWVLAHGQLQRLRLLLTAKQGPTVRTVWEDAIDLGSPLHAAQLFEFPFEQGGLPAPTLMLVTEPLTRATALATAIDANDGTIRWQRQLGLVSRGEPLVLGTNVLALDQGGGLFAFDALKFAGVKDEKLVGGRSLAPALDDGETPPVLVPGLDGKSAYEFAIPKTPVGTNPSLIVRHYHDQGGPVPVVQTKPIQLKDRLTMAGKPAVSAAGILVPLSDGSILRFGLDGAFVAEGPNWRAGREEPDLRTHVVWLNDEEFLTTDGGRNVNRWRWKAGDNRYFVVPSQESENEPTIRMLSNIATAPLALAPDAGRDGVRALVACDDKTIYLIDGRNANAVKSGEKGLKIVEDQQWNPKGKITAGPYFLGDGIVVIVDRNRLLRFTPDKSEPVWEYKSKGEAIVGQPQIVEDMLIVADQSGRFVGLDPETGKPRDKAGEGYKLRANVGPAASPVAFGPGQAFAPLTDGTILLLELKHLRDK